MPRTPSTASREFWTAKQIAERLGCSVSAIWFWKQQGKLPFYSIGKLVRFKWDDIERLMKQGASPR